jgi:hypothetical protein
MGMTKIENFETTLRLRWGYNAARTIEVPVEYRKGSYSQRYELYIDGVHIGWVVKSGKFWEAYIVGEQFDGYQRHVASETTRRDAVDWLVHKLADYARTNVLSGRAEAAYAE